MERMNRNLQNVKSNKQRSLDKLNFDGQKMTLFGHGTQLVPGTPRQETKATAALGFSPQFPPVPPSSPQFPRSGHCPRAVRASQGFS